MSYTENPQITTSGFIDTWRTQDHNRLVAELISVNRETERKPDVFHYDMTNGKLTDPETGRPILEFIAPGVEKVIARELEVWADSVDEGVAFWISPKLHGKYPCNKILIHNIAYGPHGGKVVLNSVVLFDGDLKNPEELRKTLFTAEDNEKTFNDILMWLESVSKQKVVNTPVSTHIVQQADYFAEQIRTGIDQRLIIEEMQESGFLGNNPISCPTRNQTFSSFTVSRAKVEISTESITTTETWTNDTCRVCNKFTMVGPCKICKPCEKNFE
jgi:hypothetical protein